MIGSSKGLPWNVHGVPVNTPVITSTRPSTQYTSPVSATAHAMRISEIKAGSISAGPKQSSGLKPKEYCWKSRSCHENSKLFWYIVKTQFYEKQTRQKSGDRRSGLSF